MKVFGRFTAVFCACVALSMGCVQAPSTWQNGTSMASGVSGDIDCYEAVARAEIFASSGDHQRAVPEFRIAIAAAPEDPYLWVRLAEELLAISHTDEDNIRRLPA